jgi:HK97 gp10 family phage protein
MAVDDIDFESGNVKVRVSGLRDLVRNMERAGVDAQDIKDVMEDAGTIVARRASWLAPRRTGAMANNVRVGKAKTKASIKVGSARVPYARYVYFGKFNAAKGGLYQKKNPFLYEALKATRKEVFNKIEVGMQDILKKNDLI